LTNIGASDVPTNLVSSLPQKVIRGDALLFTDPEAGFADGWMISAKHGGLDPQNLTGYVICVNPN